MAPKLLRKVAPFGLPVSLEVPPPEWRIEPPPPSFVRFVLPVSSGPNLRQARGVDWWQDPTVVPISEEAWTLDECASALLFLGVTDRRQPPATYEPIASPTSSAVLLNRTPEIATLDDSIVVFNKPEATSDLAVSLLPSWQLDLLAATETAAAELRFGLGLRIEYSAQLLGPPMVVAQELLRAAAVIDGRIERGFEMELPSAVEPDWGLLCPDTHEPAWDVPLAEGLTTTWEIGAPDCLSVPSILGAPSALGKAYEEVREGRTEQRIQQVRREREQDAIRAAARTRKPATVLVNRDLFELIKPILMPPLESDALDVVLMPQELFDYQRYGVKWLMEEPGRLLADDMGLGKTAQAITAFRALVRLGKTLNALVVCPASLMETWRREFGRWAPELRVYSMDGSEDERRVAWPIVRNAYHVVLTTYDRLRIDSETVERETWTKPFGVVIFDEIQYLKNRESVRRRAAAKVNAKRRWGLSGTPMENRVEELNSVLNLLTEKTVPVGQEKRVAATVMLRRRKDEARKDLPPLIRNKKYVELGASQRQAYDRLESSGVQQLQSGREIGVTSVLALITKLKQVCNSYGGDSCKTDFLSDYMDEVEDAKEKAIVFSQYKEHFDQIQTKMNRFGPKVFTGSLSANKRDAVLKDFEADARSHMLLMTLQSGGVGLTITAANHVIHYDSWWNPARGSQATARAHRIGQTKVVVETTLICSDTIEERIDDILQKKRALFADIVDDLADVTLSRVLTEEEFYGLFGLTSPRQRR